MTSSMNAAAIDFTKTVGNTEINECSFFDYSGTHANGGAFYVDGKAKTITNANTTQQSTISNSIFESRTSTVTPNGGALYLSAYIRFEHSQQFWAEFDPLYCPTRRPDPAVIFAF
ncbi:hypothetical protein BLNAU_20478 [Blattamonas nauphoetae]|uniref:Uncharacterized protein n=1 Tax=Blattamonas nauphoetae TaxID=2049346 RepID=A0ABQ9WZS4_9EUKA|nr:hypothetical protein BLNAU_20478 [Blattamonas nauphoetae]